MSAVGKLLKVEMEARNMTVEDFAVVLTTSSEVLLRIFNGEANPSKYFCERLGEYFGNGAEFWKNLCHKFIRRTIVCKSLLTHEEGIRLGTEIKNALDFSLPIEIQLDFTDANWSMIGIQTTISKLDFKDLEGADGFDIKGSKSIKDVWLKAVSNAIDYYYNCPPCGTGFINNVTGDAGTYLHLDHRKNTEADSAYSTWFGFTKKQLDAIRSMSDDKYEEYVNGLIKVG